MEEIIQSGGSTQLCLLFAALELSVLFAVFLFYICIKLFKVGLILSS